MQLKEGARLGPYEILGPIGAGGMGEVYRARDTRLDRTVALKVLPEHLAQNPEARHRFEREARAVSSLNHPHICVLHDTGREGDIDFLVMEYLEGETLAARLTRGPLPLDQALRYAIQIALALAQAHRQGVFHRDLKPANIMLTKAGAKLLDFGLAKMDEGRLADATISADLTRQGVIMGTFQYMAPEQLQGAAADARTDIFAFGAVLYEVATGQKAFLGSTHATLAASILTASAPSLSNPALDRLTRKCLAKDPDERWQSAQDLAGELQWIAEAPEAQAAATPRRQRPWGWIAAAVALVAALPFVFAYFRRPASDSALRPVRFSLSLPERGTLTSPPVASPDGSKLVFSVYTGGRAQLFVRSLDSLAAQPLPGSEDALFPFWSPDSRFVAFFTPGKLKKIALAGGPAQVVCDTQTGRGGAWSPDGRIVFSPTVSGGLYQVPASGGAPTPVTRLDESRQEGSHRWPAFLPDGRHFLYYARSLEPGKNALLLGSLEGGPGRVLLPVNTNGVYADGRVLYVSEGTLLAQPFDAAKLAFTGDPVSLAQGVSSTQPANPAGFSVAGRVLVYGGGFSAQQELVWFDRSGKRGPGVGPSGIFMRPQLSPDGSRLALDILNAQTGAFDVWILELSRGTTTRLTFGPGLNWLPMWSADGGRIVFTRSGQTRGGLRQKLSTGAGEDEELLPPENLIAGFATDYSADGQYLLYEREKSVADIDLWILPMQGDRRPAPLLQTPFAEQMGQFAPGRPPRWFAYVSNETGRQEVYVQTFPSSGAKWLVSAAGGSQPRWRPDGKELFYRAPDDRLMAAPVTLGPTFQSGAPRVVLESCGMALTPREVPRYDVTADGRFLVLCAAPDQGAAGTTVVLDWQVLKP